MTGKTVSSTRFVNWFRDATTIMKCSIHIQPGTAPRKRIKRNELCINARHLDQHIPPVVSRNELDTLLIRSVYSTRIQQSRWTIILPEAITDNTLLVLHYMNANSGPLSAEERPLLNDVKDNLAAKITWKERQRRVGSLKLIIQSEANIYQRQTNVLMMLASKNLANDTTAQKRECSQCQKQ